MGKQKKILVVDDESAVRGPIVEYLQGRGYDVLQADNGLEAWITFNERHRDLDMVITDQCMPGIDGEETIKWITRASPSVKSILMSGAFPDLDDRGTFELYVREETGCDTCLDKPIDLVLLGQNVCRLLGE